MPLEAYLETHQAAIEESLGDAVNALVHVQPSNPLAFVAEHLLAAKSAAAASSGAPPVAIPEDDDAATSDKWSLSKWVRGAGVHRVLAAALQAAVAAHAQSADGALCYLRGLKGRSELQRLLATRPVAEALVDVLWKEVQALQRVGAATAEEIQNKFAGSTALSFGGLDAYFAGLEGVAGTPAPKVFEGMEAEHLRGEESEEEFATANYGITTTSEIEWRFVVSDAAELTWPEESVAKLADRSKVRQWKPLRAFRGAVDDRNRQLETAGQPPIIDEELIGARLYTGPLFVKYNGVLRGLQSDSHFLKNSMVTLCCPRAVSAAYMGGATLFEPARGDVPIAQAIQSLNKYTTTLHAINSAIVKLGKLTKATKVFRGVAGLALPAEFWTPNAFDVRGGVEPAFMSTTLERDVAMGYAAGDGSKMGFVIEVQQGMVSRGASMDFLSQYPHEAEILFGPLTGIEVLDTRIEGSVVVIECAVSVNCTPAAARTSACTRGSPRARARARARASYQRAHD